VSGIGSQSLHVCCTGGIAPGSFRVAAGEGARTSRLCQARFRRLAPASASSAGAGFERRFAHGGRCEPVRFRQGLPNAGFRHVGFAEVKKQCQTGSCSLNMYLFEAPNPT